MALLLARWRARRRVRALQARARAVEQALHAATDFRPYVPTHVGGGPDGRVVVRFGAGTFDAALVARGRRRVLVLTAGEVVHVLDGRDAVDVLYREHG